MMLTDIPIVVLDLVQSVSLVGVIVIAPHVDCCPVGLVGFGFGLVGCEDDLIVKEFGWTPK